MVKAKSGVNEFIDVDAFTKQIDSIILSEAIKLAKFASENSAVGVSGRFKQSWRAFPVRGGVSVLNVAEYARQALVGISPEDASKSNDGTLKSLTQWVEVVLDVGDADKALLIARAILRRHKEDGSVRYRSGKNVLSLDPKTLEPYPDSPVLETARVIAAKINQLSP